jgi:hypothetical protein
MERINVNAKACDPVAFLRPRARRKRDDEFAGREPRRTRGLRPLAAARHGISRVCTLVRGIIHAGHLLLFTRDQIHNHLHVLVVLDRRSSATALRDRQHTTAKVATDTLGWKEAIIEAFCFASGNSGTRPPRTNDAQASFQPLNSFTGRPCDLPFGASGRLTSVRAYVGASGGRIEDVQTRSVSADDTRNTPWGAVFWRQPVRDGAPAWRCLEAPYPAIAVSTSRTQYDVP